MKEEFIEYELILETHNAGDQALLKSILDAEGITYFMQGEYKTMGSALDRLLKNSFHPAKMSYPQQRVSSNIPKRLVSRFHGNDDKRCKNA